ncbi:MAG: type II toxin-antitoxin system VapC family toxin [Gammaproteobacteria bacterium]
MSYLLDTNVVSELVRPKPAGAVLRWLEQAPYQALHLSVLTSGELRHGIERLPAGARKERMRSWLERDVPAWFGERLLPVDSQVADRWGRLAAESRRPLPTVDSLLAATALHHGLRLVTRNVTDFQFAGLTVINPWDA